MCKVTKRVYLVLLFILLVPICTNAQEVPLKDLINIALQNNQNIKSSVLDISIADKRISEVKSSMLPQLSVSVDYKYYSRNKIFL